MFVNNADLCLSKPCDAISNAVIGKCMTNGGGSDDFKCECLDGYVWSSSKKSCHVGTYIIYKELMYRLFYIITSKI